MHLNKLKSGGSRVVFFREALGEPIFLFLLASSGGTCSLAHGPFPSSKPVMASLDFLTSHYSDTVLLVLPPSATFKDP